MRNILITGANSYIGTSVEQYLHRHYTDAYAIDTVDMIDGSWRAASFAEYDTVFHVAGIAHSDNGKISKEQEEIYRSVNTDLTIETAKKAKADGAKQFIFMSSAIVYGNSAPLGKDRCITADTVPSPANCYGDSKLQAEKGLQALQDGRFRVVILRPPMIYGKNGKGNYLTLSKLAQKLPLFPKVKNTRSMLYIDNLCEFVHLMIENEEQGVFHPQNAEYSNTSELVRQIAAAHGKTIHLTSLFNWGLYLLRPFVGLVDKAFGTMRYDKAISVYTKGDYQTVDWQTSIQKTES